MEQVMATERGRLRAMFSWDDVYTVADGAVLQDIVKEHAERQEYDSEVMDDEYWMAVQEHDDPVSRLHRYRIGADGGITSGLDVYTTDLDAGAAVNPGREYGRHRTMTRNRYDALVGRANVTCAFADYLEDCHAYGILESVLDLYQEGPALHREWLEERLLKAHGPDVVAAIGDDAPELLRRVGVQDDVHSTETAVEQIAHTAAGIDDVVLDHEQCTHGRSMAGFYAGDPAMQSIYETVLSSAVNHAAIPYTADNLSVG